MLSHGHVGTRLAHKHTSMLYHHKWVGRNAPVLSAGLADILANTMRRIDARLVGGLVDHFVPGFVSVSRLTEEGTLDVNFSLTR